MKVGDAVTIVHDLNTAEHLIGRKGMITKIHEGMFFIRIHGSPELPADGFSQRHEGTRIYGHTELKIDESYLFNTLIDAYYDQD